MKRQDRTGKVTRGANGVPSSILDRKEREAQNRPLSKHQRWPTNTWKILRRRLMPSWLNILRFPSTVSRLAWEGYPNFAIFRAHDLCSLAVSRGISPRKVLPQDLRRCINSSMVQTVHLDPSKASARGPTGLSTD